jgi:DNA invertase Pin-like site-specific DNA recombinase
MTTARRIATERGWHLVDLPPEAGVSAYTGKNLKHGSILGGFINKVENKEIETPCVLIIEKLDRFSRSDVDDILPVFIKLIKSGVNVFSNIENQYYTVELLKENPIGQILPMVLAFFAANQYSKALSERVKSAKQKELKSVMEGENIYLHANCPYYMDWIEEKKIFVPNEKQKLVKQIAKDYIGGKKLQSIARELNKRQVPCLSGHGKWWPTSIKQLITNRCIIGYLKTRKIYPETISEEDYNKIQGLLERNKIGKGRTSDFINIFRGKLVCASCGKTLAVQKASSGRKQRYYRCPAQSRGVCDSTRLIRINATEQFILGILLETTPEELLTSDNSKIRSGIKDLEIQIEGITKQINRLVMLDEVGVEETKARLIQLKEQRDKLQKEILVKSSRLNDEPFMQLDSLKELCKRDDVDAYDKMTNKYNQLIDDLNKPEIRIKIRELIQSIVKRIEVEMVKQPRIRCHLSTGYTSDWHDLIW